RVEADRLAAVVVPRRPPVAARHDALWLSHQPADVARAHPALHAPHPIPRVPWLWAGVRSRLRRWRSGRRDERLALGFERRNKRLHAVLLLREPLRQRVDALEQLVETVQHLILGVGRLRLALLLVFLGLDELQVRGIREDDLGLPITVDDGAVHPD